MRMKSTLELPMLLGRAEIVASSWDDATGEFDVIFATEAPVQVVIDGMTTNEILGLRAGEVDLTWLNAGGAILYQHGRPPEKDALAKSELKRPHIGTVVKARIEQRASGPVGVARCRLSNRGEVADIKMDVKDAILTQVSVGYRVEEYRDESKAGDAVPTLRAVKWIPKEITLTPIAADPNSRVRSDGSETKLPCIVLRSDPAEPVTSANNHGRGAMTPEELAAQKAAEEKAVRERAEADAKANRERAEAEAKAQRDRAEREVADKALSDKAAKDERERAETVELDCRASGFGDDFTKPLIKRGLSIVDSQRAILDELRKNQKTPPTNRVRVGDEPRDRVRAGIQEALEVRAQMIPADKASDNAKRFKGMRLLRMVEELQVAENQGRALEDYSPYALATRALAFSSSDFPKITENVANKKLRQMYEAASPTFKKISRETSAPDFRPMSRINTGLGSDLVAVQDNGEITYAALSEVKESYSLATYGKLLGLTRQAIINDDTSAFDRVPGILGARAAIKENKLAWAIITGNPTMSDSLALFHATHANLATGGGSVLAEAGLSAGRTAMRKQTDPDGTILNLVPKILIVPAALETTAYRNVVASVSPSSAAGVSPFQGLLEVIVEPILDADSALSWYLAADLGQIDMLEHAYLSGQSGPAVQTFYDAKFDGVLYRVLHDFGVAPIDFRGLFKSAGS